MKSCRSLRMGRFVFAILVTLAGVFTLPLSSSAWPGAHKTLQCVDCHLTPPDPQVDTAETVNFVNSNHEELCLGCHAGMRDSARYDGPMMMFAAAATSTNFKHKSSGTVPQTMYSQYLGWIAENGSNYNPPLTATALRMYPSGSGYSYSCNACHVGMGGGYPPLPMTNLELCVACHGGVANSDLAGADPRFSRSPRVLYNPTHLGVTTDGSNEYPPPVGAPANGDHVQGAIPLPLTVVKSFHTNTQEQLGYRLEIDFGSDGTADQTVTDFPERLSPFTPTRWYTGEPSRWAEEMELHRQDASAWPGGTHVLKIIPYDPISLVDGNAYAMNLVVAGSSCDISIPSFQASRDTLNTAAGENVTLSGTISSSQPDNWQIDIVSPYPPMIGSGENIVVTFGGSGSTVLATWDGRDMLLNFVPPGYYLVRLTATTGTSCTTQAMAVIAVDPATVCSMNLTVGSSANLASGTLSFSQELFSARGGALPADLDLTYRGLSGFLGSVGRNWSHRYEVSIRPSGSDSYALHESDGRWRLLVRNGDVYTPRTSAYPILRRSADGTAILEEKQGSFYHFDAAGRLQSLVDRNGNFLTLAYDAMGYLASVTDPAQRVIGFTYDFNGRIISISAPDGGVYGLTYAGDLLTGLAFPDGSSWTYAYDPSFNLVSKTDPLGHVTRYQYDTAGRLVRSIDPEGNARSLAYASGGGLTVLTEKDGGLWTYRYDAHLGAPSSKTDPLGNVTSYAYDASRDLLSTTDPENKVTRYTYDGAGNMLTATDPAGQVTAYTYTLLNKIASLTDPEGEISTFAYDDRGNLTATTDPAGATTRQEYDAAGNVVRRTSALGNVTLSTYESAGNLTSLTDPATLSTSFAYDAMGNMIRRTDASGAVTTFTYDSRGRLLSTAGPDGGTVATSYDANGNRVSQTDQKGQITRYEYDANGRQARMIDPAGGVTTYSYGSSGCPSCAAGIDRLISITDPSGHTTHFEYDLLGRRTAETDALGNTALSAYDSRGNLIVRTDAAGRTTRYEYDALSRRTTVTDPLNGVVRTTFTASGRTASITDANGVATSYEYDDTGRVTRTVSPDAGVVTYVHNADGTLKTKTDANGIVTSYTYDADSRLTQITFPSASQNVSYGYDALTSENGRGRLTSMTDPTGTTVYHYDIQRRVVREVQTILGVSYTKRYQYDLAGNLTSITYPSGRVVTSFYNNRNRPTVVNATLASIQTVASAITYDPTGNPTSLTFGNGLVPTVGYDGVNRVSALAIPGITTLTYAYDQVGNILSITDGVNAGSSKAYAFDLLDRLADSSGPWGDLIWSYDANGNRLTQSSDGGMLTYAYDGNRLATMDDGNSHSYTYDAAGNTTYDGQRTFIYDQNQRLMQVKIGGGLAGQYVYDGRERRVIKYTGPAALGSSTPQNVVYHYDLAGRLVEETATDGKLLVDYVYLEGRPLAMIRKQSSGEETFYYHNDHLGSPILMTDKLGKVVWNVAMDPFGNVIPYKGRHGNYIRNVVNNLRFPGQYYDVESGLNQNWHRDYDPKLGRYVEADPAGIDGGLVPYSYGLNNPLTFTDLGGLTAQDRVNWAFNELQTNSLQWGYFYPPVHNKCNEFVYRAHVYGDPDVHDFPSVLRENGYPYPTTSDYANPAFFPQRLLYDGNVNHAQPGDILSWYVPGGAHHNALYVGDGSVIYASTWGLKSNTISAVTVAECVQPIIRRYIY